MKTEDKFRTLCCNAKAYRKGRAHYRCESCDEDVTIYLVCYLQATEDLNDDDDGYSGNRPQAE